MDKRSRFAFCPRAPSVGFALVGACGAEGVKPCQLPSVCVVLVPGQDLTCRVRMRCWSKRNKASVSTVLVRQGTTGEEPGGSGGSILKLHEDVQTCGYRDVQVMFDILTSELEASTHTRHPAKHHQHRKRPPSPPWPSCHHRSSSMIAAAQ